MHVGVMTKNLRFPHMIIVSSDEVGGRKIVEVSGIVKGSAVRARGLLFDITALFRNILGGRVPEYGKLMHDTREEATELMVAEAEALGANAIVAVRYTTSMVASGTAEILAYGTAVKLR